ncbi:hypothetical protein V8B97DRAFT_1914674 [Scleroderma yunnanense]
MLFGPLSKAAPNLYSNLWDLHLLSQGHPPRQLHVVIPVIHWTLCSVLLLLFVQGQMAHLPACTLPVRYLIINFTIHWMQCPVALVIAVICWISKWLVAYFQVVIQQNV